MKVYLDLGHTGAGKPPAEHEGLSERRVLWQYATACALVLDKHGLEVELGGFGQYKHRQAYANGTGVDLYVSCHVNAGWQEGWAARALVVHNGVGSLHAHAIGRALTPVTGLYKARNLDRETAAWLDGARALLGKLTVPGVLVEPGFIDCPQHAHLWQGEGPTILGQALAAGILNALEVPVVR